MIPLLSVIIRCKNEEQWIGHCIQSVIDSFDYPEIIVVDNKSTDESLEIARMFEHHVNITKMTLENYSPGKALNSAIKIANSNYILILSAHCVINEVQSDIFDLLNDYVSVFGKQIPVFKGRKISRRYIWSNFNSERTVNLFSVQENRYFLHNALALYKKDILINNPFDENLYGKEDRYWAKKMIDNGNSILYEPNFKCLHHWTPNGATWKGIG